MEAILYCTARVHSHLIDGKHETAFANYWIHKIAIVQLQRKTANVNKSLVVLFLPAGSCRKVMFLHLSVILFTGGEGDVFTPVCDSGFVIKTGGLPPPPGQTSPRQPPPPIGRHPSPQADTPPR